MLRFEVCARVRMLALVLRIPALVLHFDVCSLFSVTDHIGGPISPVWGETLEAGKSVRLTIFWRRALVLRYVGAQGIFVCVTKCAPG